MNLDLLDNFKKKLEKNVFGIFSKTTDSSLIEIFGLSGFDFIILDNEHGYTNYETLKNHVRAAELANLISIVRVPNHNPENISKALDIGAYGIQVPNISTKQQVESVLKVSKFFPKGERGVCKYVRAADFSGLEKGRYFKQANNALILIQVEGTEGLNNIDQILEVNGIDVLFIGPYDLSQALGVPGDIMHEKVLKAVYKIIEKAKLRDIKIGVFCDTIETAIEWKNKGINYISYSVDYGIIMDESKNLINKFINNEDSLFHTD
jgi:4-hydroxy-2-oxoheptanedioate aldolase